MAYQMACEQFLKRDYEEMALNTNAHFDQAQNRIIILFMNSNYFIDCATGEIASDHVDQEILITVKILIMHYLLHAKWQPLSGKQISFREIPAGGAIYYEPFNKRAIVPLIKTFASQIEELYTVSQKLGGHAESYGSASVSINILPLVPVTYVVWQGDEEVAHSGTILFDDTITNYLPVEDIVLAASFGIYEMIKLLKQV